MSLAGKWEFPGGKLEARESHREALEREIMEEFLGTITVGDFIAESSYDYGTGHLVVHAYWSSLVDDRLVPQEHDLVRWLGVYELLTVDLLPADVPIAKRVQESLQTRGSSGV
jgi:8-oxo-dGTP diphosphatase